MALDFSLTPERAKLIRQHDNRVFPFLSLYVLIDGVVAGQVGVFRLPMVTTEGPEDVGAVWAVCTHPSFGRRGIASRLMNEAHERMRAEGLQFSTLGTSRYRLAHPFYLKHGYRDAFSSVSFLIHREELEKHGSNLSVERATPEQLHHTDDIYRLASVNRLGFTRRFENFVPAMVTIGEIAMGPIEEKNIWFLRDGDQLIGYFVASMAGPVLKIMDMLLLEGVNPVDAVASLAGNLPVTYIHVKSNRPSVTASLSGIRSRIVLRDWSTFMVKPLTSEAVNSNLEDLFGIGTDRFLISWMDTT